MNEFPFSEDELRKAASEVCAAMRASVPAEYDHAFSPEFEGKLDRLITKARRRRTARRTLKRVALFFLVLLAGVSVWLSVDSEAREALFGWTRTFIHSETYGDSYEYRHYGPRPPMSDETAWLPAWLPEGWEIFHNAFHSGDMSVSYVNDKDRLLHFSSHSYGGVMGVTDLDEDGSVEEVMVGSARGDLYLDTREDSNSVLDWFDDEHQMAFSLAAPYGREVLLQIAESVAPHPVPKDYVYLPAWLPEGYEVTTDLHERFRAEARYENPARPALDFSWSMSEVCTDLPLAKDAKSVKRVKVGPWDAELYACADGRSALVWIDEEWFARFQLLGALEEDELLHIAESIGPQTIQKITVYRPTYFPEGGGILRETIESDYRGRENYQGTLTLHVNYYNMNMYGLTWRIEGYTIEHKGTGFVQAGRPVKIGNVEGMYYANPKKEKDSILTWTNEDNVYFELMARFSEDEMIKLAESVQAVEIDPADPDDNYTHTQ